MNQVKVSKLVARRLTRGQTFTLPSVPIAHPNASGVSRLHNVVQSLHGLLDRCIGIEAVALQDAGIIKLHTLKRFLERIKDMLRREIKNDVSMDDVTKKCVCTLRLRPS